MKCKPYRLLALLLVLTTSAFAATTWYVNGVTGSDSDNCLSATTACKTIGHAISMAASGDTIKLAPATYPENLNIGISVKIAASGAHRPVIDGGGVNTVVTVSSAAANVTLSGLRIQNGSSSSGIGGISNVGMLTLTSSAVTGNSGTGVFNSGTLSVGFSTITQNSRGIENSGMITMNQSTVTGNNLDVSGTPGISNSGTLIVNSSTISRNGVVIRCWRMFCIAGGAAISSTGALTLNNSTVSGNFADGYCKVVVCKVGVSGTAVASSGASSINNSTISANLGRGYVGIRGTATLQNSIVSNNTGGNCSGTMTSNGYNLSSDSTCAFSGAGDMNSTDPLLGPLHSNGGPTQTMALPSGSPAIDAGNPAGCTDGMGNLFKTDQRGMPRPDAEDTGGCDIGAYESQSD